MLSKEMTFLFKSNGERIYPDIVQKQIGRPVFSMILKDDQTWPLLSQSKPAVLVSKNGLFSKSSRTVQDKSKKCFKSLASLNRPRNGKKEIGDGR